ncbi:MAG: hypothetical protein U0031_06995 [Thermomicrobiales bacterium]
MIVAGRPANRVAVLAEAGRGRPEHRKERDEETAEGAPGQARAKLPRQVVEVARIHAPQPPGIDLWRGALPSISAALAPAYHGNPVFFRVVSVLNMVSGVRKNEGNILIDECDTWPCSALA